MKKYKFRIETSNSSFTYELTALSLEDAEYKVKVIYPKFKRIFINVE